MSTETGHCWDIRWSAGKAVKREKRTIANATLSARLPARAPAASCGGNLLP